MSFTKEQGNHGQNLDKNASSAKSSNNSSSQKQSSTTAKKDSKNS